MARLTTYLFTCSNCNNNYFYEKIMATYACNPYDKNKPGVINSKELTICCSNCQTIIKKEKIYG